MKIIVLRLTTFAIYILIHVSRLFAAEEKAILGGSEGWGHIKFRAVDDRVRGGSSISSTRIENDILFFEGNLDTKTLGGAGFASQSYESTDVLFNFSDYDGLKIYFLEGDSDKTYTINLANEISPFRKDGTKAATITFEANFDGVDDSKSNKVLWFKDFKATLKGKPTNSTLDLKYIHKVSFMLRSFFAQPKQEGPFRIGLVKLSLIKRNKFYIQGQE